jgi:hypothetical protein
VQLTAREFGVSARPGETQSNLSQLFGECSTKRIVRLLFNENRMGVEK